MATWPHSATGPGIGTIRPLLESPHTKASGCSRSSASAARSMLWSCSTGRLDIVLGGGSFGEKRSELRGLSPAESTAPETLMNRVRCVDDLANEVEVHARGHLTTPQRR